MNPNEHIAAAERELGLEDGYPCDEPDGALAAAHALIAIAKLLADKQCTSR